MAERPRRYSCPFFNQHIKVPDRVRARVDAEHAREYGDVRHCVGLIAVNLLAMGEVAYSRNSNFYTEHRTRLFTLTSMRRAVDAAVRSGCAVRPKEGYWDRGYVSGLSSTLAPGPRLAEFGPPPPLELDIESLPLLVVDKRQVFGERDLGAIMSGATAVRPGSLPLLPRLGGAYAEALTLNREYWNRMEIGTGGLARGSLCMRQAGLTRIFKAGGVGRWFQRGGLSYQGLPKQERAKLRLNGEAVAELDYPAMHPHLMYAWEGRPCPDDFYERVTGPLRVPQARRQADGPDGRERRQPPRPVLRRQLQQAGRWAEPLRRAEGLGADARAGRRGAGGGAPRPGEARVQRPGEQADAGGVGHNDGGPAEAATEGHPVSARARLARVPRAPQGDGQGGHGAGVPPSHRPTDRRGMTQWH